jgi:hypothetical protein
MIFDKEFPQKPFQIKKKFKLQLEQRIGEWRDLRNKICEAIPSRKEGLDIERANNFLADINITAKDYIFITDDDIPVIKKLFKEHHFEEELFEEENRIGMYFRVCVGVYFGELDLIFVNRSKCCEEKNGAVVAEGIYVHEQAHASNGYTSCAIVEGRVEQARIGFFVGDKLKNQGAFFEEGWADFVRAKYMEKYMSNKTKRVLFGKNSDITSVNLNKTMVRMSAEEMELKLNGFFPLANSRRCQLAAKYFYVANDNGISNDVPAPSGFGIELLCKKNPELFDLLTQARGDVSKLREVPKIINKMSPGLYLRLRQLECTEEDFIKGLKMIIDEVSSGSSIFR